MTKQRHGEEQIVHANPKALSRTSRLLDEYERVWRERAHRIADILAEDQVLGDY